MIAGLDIRYDLGDSHPLLGRRMPDLQLLTAGGPQRVYTMLHEARPLLVSFTGSVHRGVARWSNRVRVVEATFDGRWELPVIGPVVAPAGVLIRPDGYVCWVGDAAGEEESLPRALADWFGAPADGAGS
jgi:3-(3-hydroxy-phenyl)propionate hydroxylase